MAMREAADQARSQTQQRTELIEADLQDELEEDSDTSSCVDPQLVNDVLVSLRALLVELRAGRRIAPYDAGSARLLATELGQLSDRGTAAA